MQTQGVRMCWNLLSTIMMMKCNCRRALEEFGSEHQHLRVSTPLLLRWEEEELGRFPSAGDKHQLTLKKKNATLVCNHDGDEEGIYTRVFFWAPYVSMGPGFLHVCVCVLCVSGHGNRRTYITRTG